MSDKPSYLGLLNAIAVAESDAYEYLQAWIAVTPSAEVATVLRAVAAREGEHGMAFAKRIDELGYQVRRKDEPGRAKRLEIAGSECSDLEKMKALGLNRLDTGDKPDIFDGFFADHSIDIRTGELLGRYIAEERDSARLLRACYEQLKKADKKKPPKAGKAPKPAKTAKHAELDDRRELAHLFPIGARGLEDQLAVVVGEVDRQRRARSPRCSSSRASCSRRRPSSDGRAAVAGRAVASRRTRGTTRPRAAARRDRFRGRASRRCAGPARSSIRRSRPTAGSRRPRRHGAGAVPGANAGTRRDPSDARNGGSSSAGCDAHARRAARPRSVRARVCTPTPSRAARARAPSVAPRPERRSDWDRRRWPDRSRPRPGRTARRPRTKARSIPAARGGPAGPTFSCPSMPSEGTEGSKNVPRAAVDAHLLCSCSFAIGTIVRIANRKSRSAVAGPRNMTWSSPRPPPPDWSPREQLDRLLSTEPQQP